MEVATRYADSDGVSIAYQVHGGGPIDLVFVPGFVSHVEQFWEAPEAARFLARLASFSRLIVFDKRGQGLSDRPGRPPTLEESMDDLRAVMEAAGCERAAIFGTSEGGPMSALFAATHPDRVSSLVLYGTFARVLKAPDYPQGIAEEALDDFSELLTREWGGAVGVERPRGRASWATGAGATCWSATTRSSAGSSTFIEAARSRRSATASSRRLTGRLGRSAAPPQSGASCGTSASMCGPASTPERSS